MCFEAGELGAATSVERAITNSLELTSKLLGMIVGRTSTTNILISADYLRLRGAIVKALKPYPDALAWVLAQGNDIVPIPGTKRRRYLEENIGALEVRLTAEDLAKIDSILPPGRAAGSRYPESGMQVVNR
jgi:aryl-alcohol dehydrogenase-like predicted oxidoreductase